MRLPRFILNPAVAGWIRLWQMERREAQRLRRELQAWQDKVLLIKGMSPIHQPPPRVESVPQPPIGISAKRRQIASVPSDEPPTAEQILDAAARVKAASG